MNLKKIFTMGVVMTTIVWSLGVATLVPSVVSAADASCPTLVAGDMIKVTGKPAIYVLDNNLNYRYFSDGDVFKSWNADEAYGAYYKSITQACFDSLAQPAAPGPYHVFYRAGSHLVKYLSSDTLYVVGLDNTLYPITEAAAAAIYGTNFTWKTIGLSEWPLYTKSASTITEATVYPGMLVKVDGKTYFVDAGKVLREVSANGMTANRFKAAFVRTLPTSAIAGLTMGAEITSEVTSLTKRVGDSGTPGTTPAPTTNVTVSLAADTPASMTVPGGSTNVTMLKFNVNGSGIVNQIILKRNGIGSNSDLTNVYLYNGTTRLTSGRTIASDTNTVTFGSLNISLPVTLTAVGDFTIAGGNNGNQSGLSVVKVNTVDINNVNGNYFSLNTNATASAVTIDDISGNWEVTLGSTGADLAKFKVVAGVNDINVSRIVLRQGGALANTNLANLKLYVGSTLLATASNLVGEKLIFNLATPYTIAKSQTKNFTVTGDLTGGRTTDNVKFYVDEVTDLYVVDSMYGVGARVTNNWALGNQIVNMAGGQITLASNGPAATTLAVNTTNNNLFKVNVSSERNVTVKKVNLVINLGGSFVAGDVARIKNVKLVDTDTGYTLVGPADLSSFTDASPTFSKEFTDSFDLTAGSVRHLAIQADFDTALTDLSTIKATLDLSGANYLYDNDASEYMASTKIVPSSLVGNTITASTASMDITKTATPNNSTQVKGNKDINALGISFSAGTAQDLKLNKLTLAVYANTADGVWGDAEGDTDANTLVESISLWDGSTQVGVTKSLTLVDANGTGFTAGTDYYKADFTNLALPIVKGSNKQLVAKINLRNSFAGTKYIAVDADKALMEIENAEGNLLTIGSALLNGTTTKLPRIKAMQNGTLTAAVDGNTPTTETVITGADNVSYTTYRFTAADEGFTIVAAKLINSTPAKDAVFSKITLSYNNEAGTAVTKEGYLSSGALTFSDGQLDMYVPANTNATLVIKANLNKADDAGTTGDSLKLGLEKSANQFGASANLTDAFIAIGKASGTKVYGNTDSITLVDTGVNAKVARKTNVVVANAKTDGSSSQKINDNIGTYTFTSESEAGSSQNSTLSSINIAMSGSMISAAGDGSVVISVYDSSSFDSASLMGQVTASGADVAAGSITKVVPLTTRNEFSGVKTVYVVVDSTDTDLTPATTGTKTLGSQITSYTWGDGKTTGITPVNGIPKVGATMSYSL